MGRPEGGTKTSKVDVEMPIKCPNSLKKKPGLVYMFLQNEFQNYFPRNQVDVEADAANITTCFQELGFDTKKPFINCTTEEIKRNLTEVYHNNVSNEYEIFLVFFVTHSPTVGKLLCKDDIFYDEEMISIMKGKDHSNLLKIFVFQASQATRIPGTRPLIECDGEGTTSAWLPDEANYFIIKSSFERETSSPENGSYFLKVFCQFIRNIENGTSLFDVMTAVLRELRANRTNNPKHPRNNILPEIISTLLKPVVFGLENIAPLNPTYEVKQSIGKLMVFNYTYNSSKSVYATKTPREGSERDVPALVKSFESIGFKVEVNNDLRADDVRRTLDKGLMCREPACKPKPSCGLRHKGDAPVDYSDDTCIAVAIMTHGYSNRIQTTDEEMNIADIISRLIIQKKKNEERVDLYRKPKLFFVEVCRESPELEPLNLPLDLDDVLVFHSTYHGNKSSRTREPGTWFIQQLCKKIDSIPDGRSVSLTDFLQNMQKEVVDEFGTEHMPTIYSTLTKNLMINKETLELQDGKL